MPVEFNEEHSFQQQNHVGPQPSKMAKMLMNMGIVKDEKQANYVLISTICFLIVLFFIAISSGDDPLDAIDTSIIDPATNLPYGVIDLK
ncbi:MAG: hypothetical protein ACI92I_000628 [Acidimicrobiales bacterium]|jgi:hypothetical protein